MTKHSIIFAFAIILTVSFAELAYAQSGHMMGQGGPGSRGMGYGDTWTNYQATPEQQQAFQKIMEKYQPQFIQLADKLWAKRAQLNGALAQEKIDRKMLTSLAKEAGAIMAQSYELQVNMLADMREQGLSYYGMGMMHGGMMGGGMMGMMHGGMMGGMMGHGQYWGGGPGMMRGWGTQQQ